MRPTSFVIMCLTLAATSTALRIGRFGVFGPRRTRPARTQITSPPVLGVRVLLEGKVVPAAAAVASRIVRVARVATSRISSTADEVAHSASSQLPPPTTPCRVWLSVEEETTAEEPLTRSLRVDVGGRCFEILRGLDPHIAADGEHAPSSGAFLSFAGLSERSEHELELGALSCKRLVAGARTKRWWMGPSFGKRAADVPPETQFLLLELDDDAYVVLLPLVDGFFRSTLRATPRSKDADALQLLVNSGDRATRTAAMRSALYVGAGDNPYAALSAAIAAASARLRTFRPRTQKRAPADLHSFGWCTWDAFYQSVDPTGVRAGLRSLADVGTPARMLILDDGWQTVELDGAALSAAKAAKAEQAHAKQRAGRREGEGKANGAAASAAAVAKEAAEAAKATKAAEALLSIEEVERQQAMNDPAQHGGTHEDSNPLVSFVSEWYRTHVDGADLDALPVRLWSTLATTVFRPALRGFFISETEFTKRLSAFTANKKFEDPEEGTSLKQLLESLREELGELRVYCWHTLGGYWGGVSTTAPAVAHLHATQHQQRPTRSLLEVEPALAWDAVANCGVGAISEGHELELFHGKILPPPPPPPMPPPPP